MNTVLQTILQQCADERVSGAVVKSGVGGGIMGVVPGKMGIGVYSPCLDQKGNSVVGVRMLEELSCQWNLSVF